LREKLYDIVDEFDTAAAEAVVSPAGSADCGNLPRLHLMKEQ
jgi:hypothetical protein